MKLSPGNYRYTVTSGGSTSGTFQVTAGGNSLTLNSEQYTWSDEAGEYVKNGGGATFNPKDDHTFTGTTGTPPNVSNYGGTWAQA